MKILSTDRYFSDSPDMGHPECICSRCSKPIGEDDPPPVRCFTQNEKGEVDEQSKELRFCHSCFSDKPFTWNDLAAFIAELPEEMRNMHVYFNILEDESLRKFSGADIIDEDIYVNKDDSEDVGRLEELKEIHGSSFNPDDYEICTPKGFPFLHDASYP